MQHQTPKDKAKEAPLQMHMSAPVINENERYSINTESMSNMKIEEFSDYSYGLVDYLTDFYEIFRMIFVAFSGCFGDWFSDKVTFGDEKVGNNIQIIVQRLRNVAISYQEIFNPIKKDLLIIHSVLVIFWGGSWYSIALLQAWFYVYAIKLASVLFDRESTIESEAHALNITVPIRMLCMLVATFYAVWTTPFLARVTIAITTQTYITQTAITPEVLEVIQLDMVCGKWTRLVIGTVAVILLSLLQAQILGCLLMSIIGYERLYSATPVCFDYTLGAIKGPNNLDGRVTFLWVSAIISVLWQLLHGFQSSLLGFIVPLGFLVKADTPE